MKNNENKRDLRYRECYNKREDRDKKNYLEMKTLTNNL